MNKYAKILCALLCAAGCLLFSSCGSGEGGTSQTSQTEQQTTSQTEAQSSAQQSESGGAITPQSAEDIKNLHTYDLENGNIFAGAWVIVEGEGSKLDGFTFMFDGYERATLIKDNMGYLGKYTLDTQAGTFETELMFGLNGVYTYDFEGEDKVTLTNISDNTVSVLERVMSLDFIPLPEESPALDKSLEGAWQDDTGEIYYFGSDGIMYQNQFNAMFTYANYSAENGKLTVKYKMGDEITDEYDYTAEGDVLTLNDIEYNRISIEEVE